MRMFIILTFLVVSNFSYSASFNCKNKLNAIENNICENSQLSSLDDSLALLYKYISTTPSEKKKQISWLKERNKCKNITCIGDLYNSRIEELKDYRIPIKTCYNSSRKISNYAQKEVDVGYREDRKVDLNGNGNKELIFTAGGCNAYCRYFVYELINGCYSEVASFSAREYFISSPKDKGIKNYLTKDEVSKHKRSGKISSRSFNCLFINYGNGSDGITYTPLCFDKK